MQDSTARLSLSKRLAFALVTLAILLMMGEAFCRVTSSALRGPRLAARIAPVDSTRLYDPVYGYRMRPGAEMKAARGERVVSPGGFLAMPGTTYDRKKPAGTRRIVCIGDSRVWGAARVGPIRLSYQNAFPEVLERRLAGESPRYEVINAGAYGYTSDEGSRYLALEILGYQPDILTILFGWNDFAVRAVPRESRLRLLLDRQPLRWLRSRLIEAHLSRTAMHIGVSIRDRIGGRGSARQPPPRPPGETYFAPRVPLERYQSNLERMVRDARREDASAILMIVPPGALPSQAERAELAWQHFFYPSYESLVEAHDRYAEALLRVASELDVSVVDLGEAFSGHPEPVHSDWDIAHPLENGHLLIADALYRVIVDDER
jgi:lysophospholipase L1-like esterase